MTLPSNVARPTRRNSASSAWTLIASGVVRSPSRTAPTRPAPSGTQWQRVLELPRDDWPVAQHVVHRQQHEQKAEERAGGGRCDGLRDLGGAGRDVAGEPANVVSQVVGRHADALGVVTEASKHVVAGFVLPDGGDQIRGQHGATRNEQPAEAAQQRRDREPGTEHGHQPGPASADRCRQAIEHGLRHERQQRAEQDPDADGSNEPEDHGDRRGCGPRQRAMLARRVGVVSRRGRKLQRRHR